MLVIWMMSDKVDEVVQLDQVVAKLTKTAEYGYDVPVRMS